MSSRQFLPMPPDRSRQPGGQAFLAHPALTGPQSPPPDGAPAEGLMSYWATLYRRKWTLLALSLAGLACGYLVSLPQNPAYKATSSLEVLEVNNSFLNMQDLDPNSRNYSAETRLHTEMRMLQSNSLIREVEEKLRESYQPKGKRTQAELDWLSQFLQAAGFPVGGKRPTRDGAIRMAASTIKVRNPELTRVVEITCESTDPNVAAEFTNTLTETYMRQTVEGRLDNTARTREWLDRQIEDVKAKLQSLEADLVRHAHESGMLTTESADTLRRLNERTANAQFDLLNKSTELELASTAPPEAVTEVVRDDLVKLYEQRLMEKHTERAQLATTFGPDYYRIKRIDQSIADLETRLDAERRKVVERIKNEFEAARLRAELHKSAYAQESAKVAEQSRNMIQYNMLKREVETHRQLYDSMLQKVKEASIASAVRASNVRVVDPAEAPAKPFRPNPKQNSMMGLVTGLFIAVVMVFASSSSDRRLRSPGEISEYLQIPELGAIPTTPNGRAKAVSRRRLRLTAPGSGGVQAESFRAVVVSLLSRGAREKIFLVTSPHPAEGKTSVAANLAVVLAEIGRRVLIIDMDLRRPRLNEMFDVPNTWGVVDLLSGSAPVDQCPPDALARPTGIPGLSVLPSGPGTASIAKLLYSAPMDALLARVRRDFDTVLIDSPPMLQFPDARMLAPRADGVVMVFRAGKTSRDVARTAVARLLDDGVPITGVVLNDWNPRDARSSYYRNAYVA